MSNDKIVPIKQQKSLKQEGPVTLSHVKSLLDSFRSTKKRRNDPIPQIIWDKVRDLLKRHTEAEVLSYLSLTRVQLEQAKKSGLAEMDFERTFSILDEEEITFCEAQEELSCPLASKPAEAFATNTSIVELYRPDGMLMKIHLCTDRFEELLRAFFKG
jgi:hypothetical protein